MEKNISDPELVTELRQGNEEAFRLLLGRYLPMTYRFLVGLTHDPTASEDLAQETFIKAWKNLKRYDPTRSFKVWIFAIAKNTAYDYLRKKKTIPFSVLENKEGESFIEDVRDAEALPDELLHRKDVTKDVQEALAKIPPEYRALLILIYEEGFSLAEAAEIIGVPYNTLKSRHRRALLRLKEALAG